MKVSEIGEFGLIELLAKVLGESEALSPRVASSPGTPPAHLLLGIGDDAAVWQTEASLQLATTDTLVQGVHFTLESATWRELGWKALAVNLSDIAAMGGVPDFALVTLGLPSDVAVEEVTELYRGLGEASHTYGVEVMGGDVVGAPLVVITVALIGHALGPGYPGQVLRRAGALPGDSIAVTGHLGDSAAYVRMVALRLRSGQALRPRSGQASGGMVTPEAGTRFRVAHLHPVPRLAEGQILVQEGATAAIDISDGLVGDLAKLCQASGVAARVYLSRLPTHPLLRRAFPDDFTALALSGGEDYELLFTGNQEVMARLRKRLSCSLTVIGAVEEGTPGRVRLLGEHDVEMAWGESGWDHLALGAR